MIYDCVIINNEIDLLKMRFDILSKCVDKFVVVELNKNHRGEKKELFFIKHQNEFKHYENKIIYINADNIPEFSIKNNSAIIAFQRNCITNGLIKCEPNDIILLSDVDEIPDPLIFDNMENIDVDLIKYNNNKFNIRSFLYLCVFLEKKELVKSVFSKNKLINILEKTPVLLQQKNFYYYINCESEGFFPGTILCKYKNFSSFGYMRGLRYYFPLIRNAGWHFSYLGGVEQIKIKLKTLTERGSFQDEIDMLANSNNEEFINKCMMNGIDLYNRNDSANIFHYVDYKKINLPNIELIHEKYPMFFYDNFN